MIIICEEPLGVALLVCVADGGNVSRRSAHIIILHAYVLCCARTRFRLSQSSAPIWAPPINENPFFAVMNINAFHFVS